MNSKWMGSLAVAVLLIGGAAVVADGGTWVSKDGEHHQLHGHGDVAFVSEFDGAESLDVSELADGETRIIGAGEKQVSVSRSGDAVTIRRTQPAEAADVIDVVCRLGSDTCKVLSFDDDPERILIVVQKTRECINGEGDCADLDIEIGSFGEGDGHNQFVIRKTIDCDGEDDCEDLHMIRHTSHHGANITIDAIGDGEATLNEFVMVGAEGAADVMVSAGAGNVMFIGSDDITLRCPEGDTTMHVEKDEADEVFLCPKHSQPLERVEAHRMLHRVKGPHVEHD